MTDKPKLAVKKATTGARPLKQKRVALEQEEWRNVSIGQVTVNVRTPNAAELKKRLAESKTVATRLRTAIAKPGVRLAVKTTTPIYAADANRPELVIRRLGGRSSRGTFKNGIFVKVA